MCLIAWLVFWTIVGICIGSSAKNKWGGSPLTWTFGSTVGGPAAFAAYLAADAAWRIAQDAVEQVTQERKNGTGKGKEGQIVTSEEKADKLAKRLAGRPPGNCRTRNPEIFRKLQTLVRGMRGLVFNIDARAWKDPKKLFEEYGRALDDGREGIIRVARESLVEGDMDDAMNLLQILCFAHDEPDLGGATEAELDDLKRAWLNWCENVELTIDYILGDATPSGDGVFRQHDEAN